MEKEQTLERRKEKPKKFTRDEEERIYELASQREREQQKIQLQEERKISDLKSIIKAGTEVGYNPKTLETCAEEVLAEREQKAKQKKTFRIIKDKLKTTALASTLGLGVGLIVIGPLITTNYYQRAETQAEIEVKTVSNYQITNSDYGSRLEVSYPDGRKAIFQDRDLDGAVDTYTGTTLEGKTVQLVKPIEVSSMTPEMARHFDDVYRELKKKMRVEQ